MEVEDECCDGIIGGGGSGKGGLGWFVVIVGQGRAIRFASKGFNGSCWVESGRKGLEFNRGSNGLER